MKFLKRNFVCFALWGMIAILLFNAGCQPTPAAETEPVIATPPSLVPSPEPTPTADCSALERLPNDSPEAQQILEESIQNFKKQQPTEYMGMALFQRVDRLGEWAVVHGSVSGEGRDIMAVHQTPQGYQLAERYIITAPVESPEEAEKLTRQITQYFVGKLPEAPETLFTCLEQTWLPGQSEAETEPPPEYQLAYIGTNDYTPEGMTEIHTVQSDGSNPASLLSERLLIINLVFSPDGRQFAFWGCPGSLAHDCISGENLDVWVVNADGSNLSNLTEDSPHSDSHPDWSPDGQQIVFDSDRSGNSQIYVMNADSSDLRKLTNDSLQNTEPMWSRDGNWIAYHCTQGFDVRICVIAPNGEPAGQPIVGTTPVWSPASEGKAALLAYLCFQDGHSDICIARPDGSGVTNLTNSPSDEHSPAWSPDGNWLAFISNRNEDIDVYKLCMTCPGEPIALRLTDETQPAGWPSWSPDGNWVAYVSSDTLMLVRADRSRVRFVTGGVFGPPIWIP